jgi:hypothetical protein
VLQALLMMELSFISFEFWTVLFSGSATTLISLYLGKYRTHTATKIPFMYSFSGNCAPSGPLSTFIYYIFPGSVHIFGCSKIDRPIWEIYNLSQIDECRNWEIEHYTVIPFLE